MKGYFLINDNGDDTVSVGYSEAFKKAYKNTAKWDGGYVNDHNDRGGVTYNGISRKNFPKWEGWKIVDNVKIITDETIEKLETLVQEFFFEGFWKPIEGDEIANIDDKIAMYLYDMAVNHGVRRGVTLLQKALNDCLAVKDEVNPDGVIGEKTAKALATVNSWQLLEAMKDTRHDFYLKIIKRDKSQERYKRGWLKRTYEVVL